MCPDDSAERDRFKGANRFTGKELVSINATNPDYL